MNDALKTYQMNIEQRAWHKFVVMNRNWQLYAYWLLTQAPNLEMS